MFAHQHRAHRRGGVGEALGERHNIGQDAETLGGKAVAEAAEAGDDLVENQQDAMRIADLAETLEIALRRQNDAGGAGHRLDDDGGDGRGVVQRHQALEIIGEMATPFGLTFGEGVVLEAVGMRQMIDAGKGRAEIFAVVGDAADGDAAEANAVIALFAAVQARARRIAGDIVIGERDLERGIRGFGAGIGEEHMVELAGRQRGEARRELKRRRMAHLETGAVLETPDLGAHGFGDFLTGMATIYAPQTRGRVENLAAVGGGIMHAFGSDQHPRRALELPVGGERHQ